MMVLRKPYAEEIYVLSREHYIENGKGITPSKLKEELPEYDGDVVMATLGSMDGIYLISSWEKNDESRWESFYKPNKQSEWASLLEKILGLDPDEIEFDPAARDL